MKRLLHMMRRISREHPVMFSSTVTSIKTIAADLLVQKVVEQREDIDWRRVGVFGVFGFVYMGVAQYATYVTVMRKLFPRAEAFANLPFRAKFKDWTGMKHLVYQTAVDNFVYAPFLFFPVFYLTQEMWMTDKEEREVSGEGVIEAALRKYGHNAVEDNLVGLKIWIPADLFLFGFFPLHLRVPMMAAVSFGYCVVLSFMRGSEPSEEGKIISRSFDDSNLIELLSSELHTLSELKERNVSRDEFVELMKRIGISSPEVIDSLFSAVNCDPTQVTVADIATFLFTISQKGSASYRLGLVFQMADLEGNGYLREPEMIHLFTSLLRAREKLSSSQASDSVLLPKHSHAESERERLKHLKNRHFRYAEATSIEDVLKIEARHLTQMLMTESRAHHRSYVTKEQFETWAQNGSDASKQVLNLFSVFAPTRFFQKPAPEGKRRVD